MLAYHIYFEASKFIYFKIQIDSKVATALNYNYAFWQGLSSLVEWVLILSKVKFIFSLLDRILYVFIMSENE